MQYGSRADVQVLAERMANRLLIPLQAAAGPIGDQGLPVAEITDPRFTAPSP